MVLVSISPASRLALDEPRSVVGYSNDCHVHGGLFVCCELLRVERAASFDL